MKPGLQDATLREGPLSAGANPFHRRSLRAFLQAGLRLPLQSFDLPPQERELLEELGQRAACSADDPAELEGLAGLAVERILRVDLPYDWAALARSCARLGPLTLIVARAGRLDPVQLARLFREAGRWGCRGIFLSDERAEVGPHGVGYLVRFARRLIDEMGLGLELGWAGSNRYGTGLAQALEACEAGAQRVRGCALGVGAWGSVPLDQLLVNLDAPGLEGLADYARAAASGLGRVIPPNYPVVGHDAFRTATQELAQRAAAGSSLDPARYGSRARVCVGPFSGPANVRHWLQDNELPGGPGVEDRLLSRARSSRCGLNDLQLLDAAGASL